MKLIDNFNRVHDYLRISLTDKCNYNCIYCNPSGTSDLSKNNDLLNFEDLLRLIELFISKYDFKKFRFTGGEPLIRNGIFDFFNDLNKLKSKYGFTTGLTTNGSLLKGNVGLLYNNGIDMLNISLDSLKQNNFNKITGLNELNKLLEVIDDSLTYGFQQIKINTVIIKGINDDEILSFVEYFKNKNVNLRFIEFMPFGSNLWEKNGFICYHDIKKNIENEYLLKPISLGPNTVAKDFQLVNHKAKISFITSISEHFCDSCNRIRISPKGNLRLCLFSEGDHEINFKKLFNENYSDNQIVEKITLAIKGKWEKHPDAEELVRLVDNNMMTIGG